jgi:hypothetical protein
MLRRMTEMEVNSKSANWAKRAALFALASLTWACSDNPLAPTEDDSRQLNGSIFLPDDSDLPDSDLGPVPPLVLALDAEALSFTSAERTVTWSSCSSALNGSFSYSVRGDDVGSAIGPYNGTFNETGTVRISGGMVTALEARFTIVGTSLADPDGGDYTIRGKKGLRVGLVGECLRVGNIVDPGVSGELEYVAKIYTPSGHRFIDRGNSMIAYDETGMPPNMLTAFNESFFSELPGGPTRCVDFEVGFGIGRIGGEVEIEKCPPDLDL